MSEHHASTPGHSGEPDVVAGIEPDASQPIRLRADAIRQTPVHEDNLGQMCVVSSDELRRRTWRRRSSRPWMSLPHPQGANA